MVALMLRAGLLFTLLAFSPSVGVMCARRDSEDRCTHVEQHTRAGEFLWAVHSGMVLPACEADRDSKFAQQKLSKHFCLTASMADCEAASRTSQVHFNSGDTSLDALEVLQYNKEFTGGKQTRKTAEMHPMCAWTIVDDLRAVYDDDDDETKIYRTAPWFYKTKRKRTLFSLGGKEMIRSKLFKSSGRPTPMETILEKTPRVAICWTFTNDYIEMASHYEKYASDLNCNMIEKDCCLDIRNRRRAEASDNYYLNSCSEDRTLDNGSERST
eukprot:TRINITY_DN10349_c0_g2_i1.p1 TRINITY_DN10349_c0_g2~~TRINITY_DN10349_c0_g2_i1.p1  ORF type:complete len:270 (+),score=25.91 TRINITY_DN10349_c0_g2_i1:105-914(+)